MEETINLDLRAVWFPNNGEPNGEPGVGQPVSINVNELIVIETPDGELLFAFDEWKLVTHAVSHGMREQHRKQRIK